MEADALLWARLQFAFTISLHIIFPAFTIGLSAFIATLLILWRRTGQEHFHRLARFWTRIFAVNLLVALAASATVSARTFPSMVNSAAWTAAGLMSVSDVISGSSWLV